MSNWAEDDRPPVVVRLPEVLDADAATRLAGDILDLGGQPVAIDASALRRMSALGLQVLLAARKTWVAEGFEMTVRDPSPAYVEAMGLFGAEEAFSDAA
jgi:chemotaxis protein CheX